MKSNFIAQLSYNVDIAIPINSWISQYLKNKYWLRLSDLYYAIYSYKNKYVVRGISPEREMIKIILLTIFQSSSAV